MSAATRIAFFGLGAIGYPIAARLAGSGLPVAVADVRSNLVERWRKEHGHAAHTPASADVVVTCVTDEASVETLLLGPSGLVVHARPDQLFIDHTTTSPRFARAAAAMAEQKGAAFVDAPVSGAASGASAGALSVFAGGSPQALQRARNVLGHYTHRITHLGAAGAGQVGKLANQLAIAGTVRGLAEAVALGRGTQLDVRALLDAIGAGSARSDQLEQHREKLVDPNFDFARSFDWLDKDLALALEAARACGMDIPQAALIKQLLDV